MVTANPTLRLLYAEDNAQDADLTRSHFSECAPDFVLETVQTGRLCLERVAAGAHDLLLLDQHLPDMEGLDILRALTRSRVALPVVLVTGAGDEDLVVKALHLGAANYVPKLGNYLETLPDLLRGVLAEHRLKQARGLLATTPRRVLYVEHQSMDIELTLQHFADMAPQIETEAVHTCAEALARLGRPPACDAALIDLRMPDQSGLDLVREAKRRRLPLPPFIMLSGKGDEAAAIASLQLGAMAYVQKRKGYLDQLPHLIDRAVDHDRLDRMSEQLRCELAERQRIEEALTFKNVILSTQQETSKDGILVVDEHGQVLSSNHRFAQMWGIPADMVAPGASQDALESLMDELVAQEGFARWMKRTSSGRDETSEEEISLKDGRIFDHYSAPMFGAGGECLGRVWYFRDITTRKRGDVERDRLEEQLRVSQKMEAIGSLAGGVAHDFNNLLSVILNCTRFALDGLDEQHPVRDDLFEVKSAAERAVALTWQLLAFSRKQVLQPVTLDLNQIAVAVEQMLRRVLGEDIEFVRMLAPDLGLVRADRGQIEQVLMNLAVNARDAMPDGGKLTIRTCNAEIDEDYAARHVGAKPGCYVQLSVTDTGCGMDEQTRSRIFEPFYTTKEKGKGTGLGLSTVYGIVKQSGGGIWVYSEPGLGTTFKIYLPREVSATAATAAQVPTARLASGTETILVVEDEEALRNVTSRILESAGYMVLTAADGDEALITSTQHDGEIHLLVTDVVMPRMGGRVLTERLASTRPRLRVLFISGYTDDAIVHRGLLETGMHFLGKPFTASDLTLKVREVLDDGAAGLARERPQTLQPGAEMEQRRLARQLLRALPDELLVKLRKATVAARYDEILDLLETVRTKETRAAARLREMAELFDYDGMRQVLG